MQTELDAVDSEIDGIKTNYVLTTELNSEIGLLDD